MEKKSVSAKIKGGKRIRIDYTLEKNSLAGVGLSGDFFVHPEEAVAVLERSLEGVVPDFDTIRSVLKSVIDQQEITVVGFAPDDIAELLTRG